MENCIEDEQILPQINIKRPFVGKFFRQLNYKHNQRAKRARKRTKQKQNLSPQMLQKFDLIGGRIIGKSIKKLGQVNRNGNKIYATWRNDQIHGQAYIQYQNGAVFKGTYHYGIKTKGHFTFLNGYQYIGACLGNRFNGEGSLIFPSKKMITGEWKEYQIIGKAKIEYPTGEVYYGEIHKFKKHGQGYLFFNDGSKYEGYFYHGLITGQGTFTADGQPPISGNWIDGELQQNKQNKESSDKQQSDRMTLSATVTTAHFVQQQQLIQKNMILDDDQISFKAHSPDKKNTSSTDKKTSQPKGILKKK